MSFAAFQKRAEETAGRAGIRDLCVSSTQGIGAISVVALPPGDLGHNALTPTSGIEDLPCARCSAQGSMHLI